MPPLDPPPPQPPQPNNDALPIPAPTGNLSDVPDSETKLGLDMTGPEAHDRILFINLGFFKYGTDDKTHAGSIFLSIALLLFAILIMLIGLWSKNTEWLDKILASLWSAFLFVAGVSIGRGQSDKQ
jgi:hypothetical protein